MSLLDVKLMVLAEIIKECEREINLSGLGFSTTVNERTMYLQKLVQTSHDELTSKEKDIQDLAKRILEQFSGDDDALEDLLIKLSICHQL